MARSLILLLVLLAGCAAARVTHVDGRPVVTAIAIGTARVTTCDAGGAADASPSGALLGPCVMVQGGAMSTSFVDFVGVLASVAAAWFSGGAL